MSVEGARLTCRLAPEAAPTMAALYDEIARQLSLPAHFGANRDALWDVLTGDVEGPVAIVVERPEAFRARLGRDFDRLLDTLRAAAAARPDLTVTFA